ncbi:MAG: C40 family peptidase [Saprospiraceae bacterium]
MPRLATLFFLSLAIYACQMDTPDADIDHAATIIESIRQEYAPDKRVAIWELEVNRAADGLILKGKTNLGAAKADFQQKMETAGLNYIDSIEVLPSTELGKDVFGLVNLSACNIRSNPKHSAELATQSTLGTVLRVWEKAGEWYRIQTPDGYLGWLDPGGFVPLDEKGLRDYQASQRVVYLPDMGFALEAPNMGSRKVSDLLAGNILVEIGKSGNYTQVRFPDGRLAYLPSGTLAPLKEWLDSRQATVSNILEDAQAMLGRPYLWGGTSGKGMDCSGFTKTVFYLNGLLLPRDASQQVHVGKVIDTNDDISNLQAGDLLFFGLEGNEERKEKITHVAIYMGDSKIIHATGQVKIESLNPEDDNFAPERLQTFVRAKRFLENPEENGIPKLASLPLYK